MLTDVRDVFDMIEDDKHVNNQATRGAEGPAGNFSNSCRRSVRQLAQLLQDEVAELAELGVSQHVCDKLSPRSLLTLVVETFFTTMRAQWQNMYALQYTTIHAIALVVKAFRTRGAPGFAFFTGPQLSNRHYTDAKSSQATVRYYLRKPNMKSREGSRQELDILHTFSRLFKQVRQQRVTDKAKEKVGTRPSVTYAPTAVFVQEAPVLQGLDDHHSTLRGSVAVSGVQVEVLYRIGDIVGVSGGRAGLWFAQMQENLVRTTTPASGRRTETVKYNVDRPKVRYFVRTSELASSPHAVTYWSSAEVQGAQAVSESSNGVHFSFEKTDSVSCEAIYGSAPSFEHVRNSAGKLHRFAISLSDHQRLREMVSDLGDSPANECGGAPIAWQSDGHPFIRKHVAVQHNQKVSVGLITKWVPASEEGDPALWHMVHDDGDEEDLEESEVHTAIALYVEESGRIQKEEQVSSRGRKRTGFAVLEVLGKRPRRG